MRRVTTAVLAAAFGLLNIRGGCGPGLPAPEATCIDDRPAPAAETVSIEVPAGDLVLEFGPQGGQHVWVALEYYVMTDEDQWLHEFTVKARGTETEIGSRGLIEQACAPGWNRIEGINVFIDEATTSSATIEVRSGPYDDFGEHTRSVEAKVDVMIVTPT
jgi:hypothetical protein